MLREYGFDTNPGNTIFLVITGVTNPSSLGFLHVSTGGDPLAMTIPLSHSTAMTATDQLSSTSAGATEVTYAETFASTGRSPTALRNRGTEQFGHGARDSSRGPGPPDPASGGGRWRPGPGVGWSRWENTLGCGPNEPWSELARWPLTRGYRMRWGSYGELPCDAGFSRHGRDRPRGGPRGRRDAQLREEPL